MKSKHFSWKNDLFTMKYGYSKKNYYVKNHFSMKNNQCSMKNDVFSRKNNCFSMKKNNYFLTKNYHFQWKRTIFNDNVATNFSFLPYIFRSNFSNSPISPQILNFATYFSIIFFKISIPIFTLNFPITIFFNVATFFSLLFGSESRCGENIGLQLLIHQDLNLWPSITSHPMIEHKNPAAIWSMKYTMDTYLFEHAIGFKKIPWAFFEKMHFEKFKLYIKKI